MSTRDTEIQGDWEIKYNHMHFGIENVKAIGWDFANNHYAYKGCGNNLIIVTIEGNCTWGEKEPIKLYIPDFHIEINKIVS